ncbi:PREDICTED: uncharacterized protein LOC107358876 [Acropora digitifera]|uniref:uncharacterized protein LOC107358876 n=1 Tax=Acropora digitifera TaxID=70779 RepID=UPI00077A7C8B|nr:PREDICTED: uncharacterized protein LOC107358876 [Acropora digitifera]
MSHPFHRGRLSDGHLHQWLLFYETFSIQDGQFKEGTHYFVDEKIGSGAFGECYKAYTSNDPSTFCVKKTKSKQNELLALDLAKKENIETIVDFRGAKVENGNVVIFMELMKGKKKYTVCHLALGEFLD